MSIALPKLGPTFGLTRSALLMCTALVTGLGVTAFGQSAYAACSVTVSPNYVCGGSNPSTLVINHTNATVQAADGFSVNAPSGYGLQILGLGSLTFTSMQMASIEGEDTGLSVVSLGNSGPDSSTVKIVTSADTFISGENGDGIYAAVNPSGTGDIVVHTRGEVMGGDNGILVAHDGSGTISVITHGDVIGNLDAGIAVNHDGAGTISITANALVLGDNNGIYSYGGSDVTDMAIVTGDSSEVLGLSSAGIYAEYEGTGELSITTNGTTEGQDGIFAFHMGTGNLNLTTNGKVEGVNSSVTAWHLGDGDIFITTNDEIIGTDRGIVVEHDGTGSVYLNINDHVSSTDDDAISVTSGTSTTDVVIETGSDSNITSTNDNAIFVEHKGTGNVELTLNGLVNGASDAVYVVTDTTAQDIIINTSTSSIITSQNNIGLLAEHYGLGNLNVTFDGQIDASSDTGMFLISGSNAKEMNIQTVMNSDITSGYMGIYAVHNGSESLSLNLNGIVTGQDVGVGMITNNASTSAGIYAVIDEDAIITGTNGHGLTVENYSNGVIEVSVKGSVIGNEGILVGNMGSGGFIALNSGAKIEGTGGTAITYGELSPGVSLSTAVTELHLYGGRLVGDVVDINAADGYSLVRVLDDFTSEGNFQVSNFEVDTGRFTLRAGDEIDSVAATGVQSVFASSGTGGMVRRDMHVYHGGLLDVTRNSDLTIGGALQNNGSVLIDAGSVLSVDTMNAGNGVLTFGVASKTDHGFLYVANGAANLTGQQIKVDLKDVYSLSEQDVFKIIQGQGAVIGGPGSTLTDVASNSVLWKFKMVDGNNAIAGTDNSEIFLVASQATSVDNLANTQNNTHAAESLMGLQGTTNAELQKIVANLNNASTREEFNAILESVQGAIDAGDSHTAMAQLLRVQNITNLRLENLRFSHYDGMKSHQGMGFGTMQNEGVVDKGHVWATSFGEDALPGQMGAIPPARAWGGVAGQYAKKRSEQGIAGYKAKSSGGAIGIDTGHLFKDMTVGVAFGNSHIRVQSENANRSMNKIEAYQGTIYGEHRLPHNSYANASVSYAVANNDTYRYDVGGVSGLTARGEYDSQQIGVTSAVGHHMMLGDFMVTPSVHADWLRYSADSYTEQDAGGAGLVVKSKRVDSIEGGLRLKVRREFVTEEKNRIIPEIRTGYRYDFVGDTMQKTLRFAGGGNAFTVESPDPARHKFNIGTGVMYKGNNGMDFSIKYDLDLEKKYKAHAVMLQATYNF